ncbi:hypothetical protein, partial [Salmonella sp. s55004]|uniref:hypothetical protein n=1 Tax=Salmonella sp. s55004 TaxID=3159675 RepID=UPI0039800992
MHESDARSVSTVQKRERVKTANFLIQKTPHGTRNFFVSRETLAGFGVQPRISHTHAPVMSGASLLL